MIYQMLVALVLNMNATIFFFHLPYQVLDLGGTQKIVSMLSVLHSFVYVVITGWYSRRNIDWQQAAKIVKRLIVCFIAIYFSCTVITRFEIYFLLVTIHGIGYGIFWPTFWAGYNAGRKKSLQLSTSIIFINATSTIAPILAGNLYLSLNRYLMLVPAVAGGIVLLSEGPLNRAERKRMERNGTFLNGSFAVRRRVSGNVSLPDISSFYMKYLLLTGWVSIFVTGYLEGIIRSASAIYLMKYQIGSDIWGEMLSIKILAHTVTICFVRYLGEHRVSFYKMRRKWFCFAVVMIGGSLLMQFTGYLPFLFLGMAGLGIGNGMFQFLCLYVGSQIAERFGRNVNGIAESMTGIGILAGSFVSGYVTGNPFLILLVLSLAVAVLASGIRTIRRQN